MHFRLRAAANFIALLTPALLFAQNASIDSETASPVSVALTATGEFWQNTAGGRTTGSRWNSLIDLSAELDLSHFGGPSGSSITAQLFWIENQNTEPDFSDLTGAANPVSGIHAADAWRVFNLYYRQSWGDERLALKLGQLAIDDDFMGSEYAGLFAHSAFGAMPSQVATPHGSEFGAGGALPIFAVAAPGIHFLAHLDDRFAFQVGLYHGGPGPDERSNHGSDWETGAGQGVALFYEGSCSFSFQGLPSTLRAGGAIHTGKFDDFRAIALSDSPASATGLYSFYLIQDLLLAARDADHPSIGAFWRLGLSPQQDRSVVHVYGDAGFNWFGPLPSRPDDILGLAVSYTEYGKDFRRLETDLSGAETAVELTYRAQLTDRLALQAILQRHFNPLPADDGRRHPATVLGCRAELSF